MSSKFGMFFEECLIGTGFLGGVFFRSGSGYELPQYLLFVQSIIDFFAPNSDVGWVFFLMQIILSLTPIFLTYVLGGKLGLLAVGMAWIGGFLIENLSLSIMILLVAILVGAIATRWSGKYSLKYSK